MEDLFGRTFCRRCRELNVSDEKKLLNLEVYIEEHFVEDVED